MTKKDYKIIAEALAKSLQQAGHFDVDDYSNIISNFCYYLKADNPNFSSDRFVNYIAERLDK